MRSTRSISRERTSERGFVLALALIVSALYFGLMALMLMDGSRALIEAQRFRARVTANVCAENAIELAARNMVLAPMPPPTNVNDGQCDMMPVLGGGSGPGAFILSGEATTLGVPRVHATARVQGVITPATPPDPARIVITESFHSQ